MADALGTVSDDSWPKHSIFIFIAYANDRFPALNPERATASGQHPRASSHGTPVSTARLGHVTESEPAVRTGRRSSVVPWFRCTRERKAETMAALGPLSYAGARSRGASGHSAGTVHREMSRERDDQKCVSPATSRSAGQRGLRHPDTRSAEFVVGADGDSLGNATTVLALLQAPQTVAYLAKLIRKLADCARARDTTSSPRLGRSDRPGGRSVQRSSERRGDQERLLRRRFRPTPSDQSVRGTMARTDRARHEFPASVVSHARRAVHGGWASSWSRTQARSINRTYKRSPVCTEY